MEQVAVSIVIPVHNAEKYLRQCIDSILRQTYPFFELICVDDGSVDASNEILKEYERQDSRVILIEQSNQYAGVARNNGIKKANGKYLLFLDADDFFEDNMLELLVEKAELGNTEVLVFDAFQFDNQSQKVINPMWSAVNKTMFGEDLKSADDIADVIFDFTTPVPWNKLFLREFIIQNKIMFQELKRSNDIFFVYAALSCAKRIGVLDSKLMFYRDNNKTSLQGSGTETPTIFADALYELKDFLLKKKSWEKFQKSFATMAISLCLYNWDNMSSKKAYDELAYALKNEILPKLSLGVGKVDSQLRQVIQLKSDIVVYGAGTIARIFVNYLLNQCEYEKEKISIAVSSINNNVDNISDIEVKCFKDISENKKKALVVIAVSDEKSQKSIKSLIVEKGFEKNTILGLHETVTLVRNGIDT